MKQRSAFSLCSALVAASLLAQDARAEIVVPEAIGFLDSPPTVLPDGRFHARIWAQVPTAAHVLHIESVTWTGYSVRVEVLAERTNFENPIPIPSHWNHNIGLHIENLPPGSYPLELGDEQIVLDVPGYPGFRDPAPIRLWPQNPGAGEDVWLLFESPLACSGSSLTFFSADAERGRARAQVDVTPDECPEEPRLEAVKLGPIDPGEYRLAVEISRPSRDGSPNDQRSREVAYLALDVSEAYPARMGGSWFDPAQGGHGITLEFIDDGALLFWYTFDEAGNPAWLVAQGPNQGGALQLAAQIVSGGAFPPAFDPDEIEREVWGTITVDLESCFGGNLSWETAYPGFASGEMPLVRLSGANGFRCDRGPGDADLRPDWYQGPATFFRIGEVD